VDSAIYLWWYSSSHLWGSSKILDEGEKHALVGFTSKALQRRILLGIESGVWACHPATQLGNDLVMVWQLSLEM